ncbi:hypothetical protein BSL82_01285 [Tardibacter chloracetimidivorans]|uniref:Tail terminator n=1 Tax=Tardibacter chloracetimidivorans TaxID=1921510 RepID=A0A1L3ZR37_9SPHN|nr:phage tail terminator-like protein [Tardibacter chloracetimidivorans]API58097.1 hypothetical protein BSL82_01285 [Tardibacter chloracetimidivorans]
MSIVHVRAALESALAAMTPAMASAWENTPYAPVSGTPYQRVYLLTAEPENIEWGPSHTERGYLQVSLAYPLDAGPSAAATRAELIRATFYRGRSFTSGGVTVVVERTPEIASGRIEDDRYVVPVKVRFYAIIRS